VIIINGLKHSAEDVEASIARSHEIFAGSAGAAFAIDDGGQEQAVVVQEVRRGQLNPDELADAVTHGFASVTRERGLRLFDLMLVRVGSLARTSSGKVRRSQARDTYLANDFERINPVSGLFPANGAFTSQRNTDLFND